MNDIILRIFHRILRTKNAQLAIILFTNKIFFVLGKNLVPKPTRQGAQTGEETRRSCDERKGRSRIVAARTVAPCDDVTSSADDEWYDAPPPLPPGGVAGRARAAGAGRAPRAVAVTSPATLLRTQ